MEMGDIAGIAEDNKITHLLSRLYVCSLKAAKQQNERVNPLRVRRANHPLNSEWMGAMHGFSEKEAFRERLNEQAASNTPLLSQQ